MNKQTHPSLSIILHYIFKCLHPIGAIIAIYLGYNLFILGVTGDASLVIDAKDFRAQLLNAAPGLIMALAGLVVLGISAWRGAPVNSSSTQRGTKFMANEAGSDDISGSSQNPEQHDKSTEHDKNRGGPSEMTMIGPHVPWDYKRNKAGGS